MNTIIISGRFTADPELKTTNSGIEFCTFTLAVDRDYKQGDERPTDFFNCTAWRGTSKFITQYFGKGRKAVVIGSMESRRVEGDDGTKRTYWDLVVRSIEFADSKTNGAGQSAGASFSEVEDDGALPF